MWTDLPFQLEPLPSWRDDHKKESQVSSYTVYIVPTAVTPFPQPLLSQHAVVTPSLPDIPLSFITSGGVTYEDL